MRGVSKTQCHHQNTVNLSENCMTVLPNHLLSHQCRYTSLVTISLQLSLNPPQRCHQNSGWACAKFLVHIAYFTPQVWNLVEHPSLKGNLLWQLYLLARGSWWGALEAIFPSRSGSSSKCVPVPLCPEHRLWHQPTIITWSHLSSWSSQEIPENLLRLVAVKGGVPAAVGTPAVWPFSSQAWLSWLRSLNTLNLKLCQSETVGWSSFLDHHQSWQIFMCLNQLEYWVRLPQIFLVWGKYIWSVISETSNKNAVVL